MITYRLKIDVQGEREQYSDMVFTSGDKGGYRLEFAFYSYGSRMELSGCALTVKARRADGAVVIDSGYIEGQTAYYDVADNAFDIPDKVELEVSLTGADGSQVVVSVITARVRAGFGESGLSSEDNEPVLAKLEAQALTTQGAVNGMRAELDLHKTSAQAHAEAFALERTRFNPLYANALLGSAAGNNITVSDAVEGTPLSLSLYGATTETLADPSAEKSPDNPVAITGIGESGSVTVTRVLGKNLFDADTLYDRFCAQAIKNGQGTNWFSDNVTFDGRNCVKNTQLGVSINAPLFENGKPNTQYTFKWSQYINADADGFGIQVLYTDGSYHGAYPTKWREWETMTLVTTAGKTVRRIRASMKGNDVYANTYIDKSSMMLNEGSAALPYEAYSAQEITIPLDSPLYGINDRKDRISGGKIEMSIINEIISTDNPFVASWHGYGQSDDYFAFYLAVNGRIASGMIISNCFQTNFEMVYNKLGEATGGWAHQQTNSSLLYFCLKKSRGVTSVDEAKAWFDAQKEAGTPVRVLAALETPVVTDITDTEAGQALLALTAQNGATIVNSEGADMEVGYNRDVNKAFEELQNAVAALNAAAVDNI